MPNFRSLLFVPAIDRKCCHQRLESGAAAICIDPDGATGAVDKGGTRQVLAEFPASTNEVVLQSASG